MAEQQNELRVKNQVDPSTTSTSQATNILAELGVIKKLLLDVAAQFKTVHAIQTELGAMHKAVNAVSDDAGELRGMSDTLTECQAKLELLASGRQMEVSQKEIIKTY